MRIIQRENIQRVQMRLQRLYGERAALQLIDRLILLSGRQELESLQDIPLHRWDQRDSMLITYGDMLYVPGEKPLVTLQRFLRQRLQKAFSTVHILPFFPSSSDEGFSIIDYRSVDPRLGSWTDIEMIGEDFNLMFDLVLNHISRQSAWFRDYVHGVAPARDYFIEIEPTIDLSAVVRPRRTPLRSCANTLQGERCLWTTFSEDQIDLNYANPNVLFEFVDILLYYVSLGARIIRLDAVAYLWKQSGTTCVHLPETHEIVKLLRDILDLFAPGVLLLTEANFPHDENTSYFGHGDEAHLVYQFSLGPLLLHALLKGTTRYLSQWVASLSQPPPGCTFLNFTASHDGIGVRPLEGLVPENEIEELIRVVQKKGGHVSTRTNPDGTESPYEVNITYIDALADPGMFLAQRDIDRFLCSQSVMLALKGIPTVYFHSLTAMRNDQAGVEHTGEPRAINRKRWDQRELDRLLESPDAPARRVFKETVRLLRVRTEHPSFHPDGAQKVLSLEEGLFGVVRTAPNESETIVAINNFTEEERHVDVMDCVPKMVHAKPWQDLINPGRAVLAGRTRIHLAPYQTVWLCNDT